MIYRWELREGSLPFNERRTTEAVLVEIDGPQLVLAKGEDGSRSLGLFADSHDDGRELWLFSPTTDMEIEALIRGAVSMRDAVEKPTMALVEYDGDRPTSVWGLRAQDVPRGVLPVPGADLPVQDRDELLRALLPKSSRPTVRRIFRCGGKPVKDSSITFGALSGIAGAIQVLWSSIGESLPGAPAVTQDEIAARGEAITLRMQSSMAASFGIVVSASNDETFKRVAAVYKRLSRMTSTEAADVDMSPVVLQSYDSYLATLANFDAEVFAHLDEAEAYISSSQAVRVRGALRARFGAFEAPPELPPPGFTGSGFFHAADLTKKTFTFFDPVTGNTIKGKIAKDIADPLLAEGQEIGVGARTRYEVRIEPVGRRQTMTLVQLFPPR